MSPWRGLPGSPNPARRWPLLQPGTPYDTPPIKAGASFVRSSIPELSLLRTHLQCIVAEARSEARSVLWVFVFWELLVGSSEKWKTFGIESLSDGWAGVPFRLRVLIGVSGAARSVEGCLPILVCHSGIITGLPTISTRT